MHDSRTKTVSASGRSAAPTPARLTALQDEERSSRDDKEEGGSEGSEEGRRSQQVISWKGLILFKHQIGRKQTVSTMP